MIKPYQSKNAVEEDLDDETSSFRSEASSPTFSYFSISSSNDEEEKPSPTVSTLFSCMKSSLRWKASLLRERGRKQPELTEEDLDFLTENTQYSEQEIRGWFKEFVVDCPEGILSIERVKEMMNVILPDENGGIIADLIFSSFDKDKNGSLDFCEFILAIHCTSNCSPEDKLHWVFQLYDKDSSGSITMGEMIQVFATLYENEGLDEKIAVERAEKIFSSLDINNDGDISEEEFVKGCMEDEEMVKMLSESSTDLNSEKISESNPTNSTCMVALEHSASLITNTIQVAEVFNRK